MRMMALMGRNAPDPPLEPRSAVAALTMAENHQKPRPGASRASREVAIVKKLKPKALLLSRETLVRLERREARQAVGATGA